MSSMAIERSQGTQQDTDEQRMLRDSVTAFVQGDTSVARVRKLRGTEPGFDRALWQKMGELGWTGILIPGAYGGSGLGFAEMRVVAEELARALVPEPLIACAVLARGVLLYGENEALRRDLLPRLASGSLVPALAWQESGGGTDPAVVQTSVRGGLLNGSKRFVTPASGADGFIVTANDDAGLCAYWVPAAEAGVSIALETRTDGSFCGTIAFHAVPVTPEQRVAGGAAARAALQRSIDEANVVASAELFGLMDQALNTTLDYMRTRVQFGKAIGSFQGLQHRAVDLFMQKELSIGAVADAVRAFDGAANERDRAVAASRAKSRCADAGLLIARECIKLHGAIGFADECDIGLYLQRALVLSAWLGNAAVHRRRFQELAPTIPVIVRTTKAALPESPPGTDWNAMSDDAFRLEVRSYFEAHYPENLRYLLRRARWSETRDWAMRMSKKGWIAPAWPREHGGMGLSSAKLLIFIEEQERWGIARAPDQGVLMLGPIVMKYGTEQQKREYLPKIISCEHVWCQGYSEPNAGSDLASLRTEAVADGDHYIINGSKIWSSLAQDGTHMFMLARTDKNAARRQDGISFFILDLKTPGIRIRPIRNIEGHEEFCEEFFDNVRIPKQNLVGQVNCGWTVAKALLGFERLNNGSPRRAQYPILKLAAIARAKGVWDDPEFQSKYIRLRLDVADLGSAYQRFSDLVRRGEIGGPEVSFLKIWAGETLQRLGELAIETAGDAGCLRGKLDFGGEEVDVLGPYYQLFGATIASGTNDIQRNILAKRVLKLPG